LCGPGMFSVDHLIRSTYGKTFTVLKENFDHMGS